MFNASQLGRTSRALTNVIHLLAVTAPENDCPLPGPCVTAFPSGTWPRYFSLRLYSSCDGALIPSAYVRRHPSFSAFGGVIPAAGWRWIWMSHLYGTNIYKNNNSKDLQQAAPNLGAKSPGSSVRSEKLSSDLEIIVHSIHRKGCHPGQKWINLNKLPYFSTKHSSIQSQSVSYVRGSEDWWSSSSLSSCIQYTHVWNNKSQKGKQKWLACKRFPFRIREASFPWLHFVPWNWSSSLSLLFHSEY